MTIAVNGVFQDPNYLIGFLMFSVVYYYGEFLNKKSGLSLLNLFVFILFVLLTGSRGGFLAILGAVAFYTIVWLKNKGNGITSIIKFISILFVLSFLLSLSINLLPESIQQRYDLSYTLEDGGANRFDIWEITINSYSNLPLLNQSFGTGAGTIGNIFNGDGVSHNIWLESLVEIGIIGTTILFLLYLFFFIKMYIQKEFIISAVFVGYMIMAMSLSLYSYKPIWNILLLIIIIKNYNCDVE